MITKVNGLEFMDCFADDRITNIDDLCMNQIRDNAFELYERGYNVESLEKLLDYFEKKYNWKYDPHADNYTLLIVSTNTPLSEVDMMHEITTANKCLGTLLMDNLITAQQYKTIRELYQRAYNDCIKVLCGGWKRGIPKRNDELVPYNVLCDEQKIINEGDKTYLTSIYD